MAWLIYQVSEGVGTVQEVLRITGIHTGDWSVDLAEPNNVEKMRLWCDINVLCRMKKKINKKDKKKECIPLHSKPHAKRRVEA